MKEISEKIIIKQDTESLNFDSDYSQEFRKRNKYEKIILSKSGNLKVRFNNGKTIRFRDPNSLINLCDFIGISAAEYVEFLYYVKEEKVAPYKENVDLNNEENVEQEEGEESEGDESRSNDRSKGRKSVRSSGRRSIKNDKIPQNKYKKLNMND